MSIDQVEHVGAVLGSPRESAAEDFFEAISGSGALPEGIDVNEATSAVSCALLGRLDLPQARRVLDALPSAVVSSIGRCPIHGGAAGERFGAADFVKQFADEIAGLHLFRFRGDYHAGVERRALDIKHRVTV